MVLDASTGESLPGVNVYLSGTTVGIATGVDRSYELTTRLSGSYELVVKASNKEWKRNYQLFEEQFIGRTAFARQAEVASGLIACQGESLKFKQNFTRV